MEHKGELVHKRNGRILATLAVAFSVAACGGGGGGGGGNQSVPPPAPTPTPSTATVTITPKGPIVHNDYTGVSFTTMAEGTVAATNLAPGESIYLRLRDTNNTLAMPATQPVTPNQPFKFALGPKGELMPSDYSGQIEFTACRDAQCTSMYGPPVSVAYSLDIWTLGEWETIQRDATHAGFVPTTIDTTRLNLIWDWRPPAPTGAVLDTFITRPATDGDGVAVLAGYNRPSGPQEAALYSIHEHSGKTRWSYAIPSGTYAQAPATGVGQVFLQTLNSPTLLTSFDPHTGAVKYSIGSGAGTGTQTLAPTSYANLSFYNAGPNGSELHSIDNVSGTLRWSRPRTTNLQAGTPTVRTGEVIYQSGNKIEIVDILTGAPRGTINDPSSDGASSAFARSIVALGSRGNAIAVSYNSATGAHPLSSFNLDGRRWEWSTSASYRSFAVSDGMVYAYREGAPVPTLDAIDEATGTVSWSWSPQAIDAQVRTTGNIMLTRNLVFISTEGNGGDSYVWAIDRATRLPAWRYPGGGYVIMSGGRTIFVLTGPGNGRPPELLRAFRVQ